MVEKQIYERALAELRRQEARVEELRAFLRIYEELAGLPVQPTSEDSPADVVPQRKVLERGRGTMQDWEQMADTAIRREGRPLRPREIYDAIVPMGFHIDSKDPVNALTTKLSRSPYFTRPGRGLFTVKEVEPLSAVHEVSSDEGAADDDVSKRQKHTFDSDSSDLWERAAKGA